MAIVKFLGLLNDDHCGVLEPHEGTGHKKVMGPQEGRGHDEVIRPPE